ncbi:AGAP010033-PA-like protein [Anopheles sinensis]|uniref:SKA complex subunit 1 n=1 Tax=Anopheles sinensis TaxID=74873 RepID=A0A084VD11_ANOSI|nr:AGAP010033-PA-like protein [Anopheles sinensis]
MDTLEALFQKQIETIKRIELFLDIYKCKQHVSEDLRDLRSDVRVASEKLHQTREYLETDRKQVSSQFIEIMRKMRRNELLMLHLLELAPSSVENAASKPAPKIPSDVLKEVQNENPTKMYLADYSKSPFTVRSKHRAMKFYDFDAEITEEQFDTIPKYLKGRMQLSELTQFLQGEIIKCFEDKYALMYKQRKAIPNQQDVTVWKEYNNLQANFPGHSFITQDDLTRKTGKVLDKKTYSKLQMLRHLHILQEVRSEGIVYFLWVYNK